MTSDVNSARRPTLAPLWTGYQALSSLPGTAFRAAHGPLLSPSPLSSSSLPSAVSHASYDGLMRKKDQSPAAGPPRKANSSSVPNTRPLIPTDGQSPLVSKLEKATLQLADAGKPSPLKSPSAGRGDLGGSQIRHKLQPRDDYGNSATADAFVIARSIRRPSSPAAEDPRPFWEDKSPNSKLPGRFTLRAVIRPKTATRQTFLIQRNLDISELRVAALEMSQGGSYRHVSPSPASRTPLPVPAKWSSADRRPSTALPSRRTERSPKSVARPTDYDKLTHDPKTVPIHISYAVSTLPALATLLTTGHVHRGDIMYLPVPHAESWPQTVRYVYTGEGELTTAMRENIIFLGGTV
ncbi:putative DET1- and DDB1-associated protein 1 [Rosellinia necatrix]|uniref:Putative DET1-and DDB1-associated protein 1 n=1 Tax=Rosellinia necatrix TaxID=77044 RepID=A0A1W2TIY0_ROSNE|nr:putative DET1- and DDB1-associated protein 1 [Rosellinia necatrix]